jgi:hypothetical protein
LASGSRLQNNISLPKILYREKAKGRGEEKAKGRGEEKAKGRGQKAEGFKGKPVDTQSDQFNPFHVWKYMVGFFYFLLPSVFLPSAFPKPYPPTCD